MNALWMYILFSVKEHSIHSKEVIVVMAFFSLSPIEDLIIMASPSPLCLATRGLCLNVYPAGVRSLIH